MMKAILDTLSALLTPAIAVVTTTIVVLQYRTARQKWRLDLFDKRYPVFIATMSFIASVVQKASIKEEDLFLFVRESKDRDLLFGDEVKAHLEFMVKQGADLLTHIQEMEDRKSVV